MKSFVSKIVIIALFLTILGGCAPRLGSDANFFGTWKDEERLPDGFASYLQWTFKRNSTFKLEGYPPLIQEGKFRVEKIEGNKVTLFLFEQKGDLPTEDRLLPLVVGNNTLTIDGQLYKPVTWF